MAGKGEFLLHGLIGGASGAIAALVNMYVRFTSFHTSLLFTRHLSSSPPSSARVSQSPPTSVIENKLITAHQKHTSHSTKHSMKATTNEQNNSKTS
jgi:hypothetical protein